MDSAGAFWGEFINECNGLLGCVDLMPTAPRIDHDIGTVFAASKTAGFVGHDAAIMIETTLAQGMLHGFEHIEGSACRAACTRLAFIGADKEVVLVAHGGVLFDF